MNQGWNALEGENTVDLSASVLVTTLNTTSHGTLTVENSNITHNGDGSATITTGEGVSYVIDGACLLYTSPSPRDRQKSRMPSSA